MFCKEVDIAVFPRGDVDRIMEEREKQYLDRLNLSAMESGDRSSSNPHYFSKPANPQYLDRLPQIRIFYFRKNPQIRKM